MKWGEYMNNPAEYSYPMYPYSYPNYMDYMANNNAVSGQSSCFCKKSFIRVLNTNKNSKYDVLINDILMAENLNTGEFTRYAKFSPGTYHIKLYEAGEIKKLIFESTIDIHQNLSYTGVIALDDTDPTDLSVFMIPEAKENVEMGSMSALRFANFIQETQKIEMKAADGATLISGVKYGDVSINIAIPSGRYEFILTEKATNKPLKNFRLDIAPRMHYTLFAQGSNSDIKIIIPEDGVNYLELC